jgi:hypothetical protein
VSTTGRIGNPPLSKVIPAAVAFVWSVVATGVLVVHLVACHYRYVLLMEALMWDRKGARTSSLYTFSGILFVKDSILIPRGGTVTLDG